MMPRIAMLAGTLILVVPAFGQKPLAYSSVPFTALGQAPPAAIAECNGDGKQDIIFSGDAGNSSTGYISQLQLLLGNGDGTFRQGPPLPIPSGEYYVAAGDLNGDDKPDLAVCLSLSVSAQPNPLLILINQGGGTAPGGRSRRLDSNQSRRRDLPPGAVALRLPRSA